MNFGLINTYYLMSGEIKKDITIKVLYGDQEFELKAYHNEYRNLMMLIYDKIYIDDFGECTGMGRCGTCLVEFLSGSHELSQLDRNENTTIEKVGLTNANMRLSCQILVDKGLHNSKIRIVEQ